MPDIEFNCPHCKQSLAVEETGAGLAVLCPGCGQQLTVPHPNEPSKKPRLAFKPSCPSCGNTVQQDAVICVNCGLNLKTGAKVESSVKQSVPVVPAVLKKGKVKMLKRLATLILTVGAVLMISRLVFRSWSINSPVTQTPKQTPPSAPAPSPQPTASVTPASTSASPVATTKSSMTDDQYSPTTNIASVPKSQPTATPAPAKQVQQAQQPYQDALLKGHLERLKKSYAEHEIIRFPPSAHLKYGGSSDDSHSELADLHYDVSSLASSVIGHISFKLVDRNTGGQVHRDYNVALSFKDGHWVISDLTCPTYVHGRKTPNTGVGDLLRQQELVVVGRRMGLR